jgi:hypothetical protein
MAMGVVYTTVNGQIISENRGGVVSNYAPDNLGFHCCSLRLRIPTESGHSFQCKADSDSNRKRTPVPTQSGQSFKFVTRPFWLHRAS